MHQKIKEIVAKSAGGTTRSSGKAIPYHSIPEFGITGMHLPAAHLDRAGIRDLKHLSVLDIGSNIGGCCFDALKRGARSAHGIEIMADRVEAAREIAKALKSPATFEVGDARTMKEMTYDVVLYLDMDGINPRIEMFEKLARMTKKELYFQFRTPLTPNQRAVLEKHFAIEDMSNPAEYWMTTLKCTRK